MSSLLIRVYEDYTSLIQSIRESQRQVLNTSPCTNEVKTTGKLHFPLPQAYKFKTATQILSASKNSKFEIAYTEMLHKLI